MAEIDPVILELRAEMGRYRAELKSTTALAETNFRRQEQSVTRLERQIKSSSANIGSTLKGLVGTFAAAFSVQQVTSLIDSYTRFKNQLRTAGLEGQALAQTQERLLAIAQRYGVELEAIGTLYGRSAAAAKELGLNQADQARITETTAAALKISGASAASASGALLQLSQVLGGSKVQAEEYNSLIDALRPLLQGVAAGSDKWKGSVARLTADVKTGKVTVQEFVDALLKGSQGVIDKAAQSTLTLSGAFTKLTNALTIYIGQSAEANGVTNAVAGGMELLANNLDTVADALAVIAAVMLGRFVAAMVAGAAAAVATQVAVAGVTTGLGVMGAAATVAGSRLLAAFGGPVGIAVAALAIGIGYLVTRTDEAAQASAEYVHEQERLREIQKRVTDATDQLSTATGKARAEAIANAKALREETLQYIANAKAALIAARAKALQAKQNVAESLSRADPRTSSGFAQAMAGAGGAMGGGIPLPSADVVGASKADGQAMANWRAALKNLQDANAEFDRLTKIINAPPAVRTNAPGDDKKKKKKTGPTPEEIEARFQSDMRRAQADQLQDELAIATDIGRRREILNDLSLLEYEERLAQIKNEKDYSDKQKAALIEQLNERFGVVSGANGEITVRGSDNPRSIQARREDEEAARAIAERQNSLARDALEAEAALVDDRRARLEIERRILKLQQDEEQSRLEAAIAAGEIADAAQARADLERKQAADRAGLDRDGESPFARKARQLNKTTDQIRDDAESLVVDELEAVQHGISDALAKKLGTDDPLIKGLIDLFIEQFLIRPITDALSQSGQGGLGGGIAGIFNGVANAFAGLFGRASGGYVGPGQTVRVNEHAGGVELLRMGSQGGKVIPLGQTRAATKAPGNTVVNAPMFNLRGAVVTRDLLQEMQRISNGSAAKYSAAMGKAVLQQVPGRMAQFDVDGT